VRNDLCEGRHSWTKPTSQTSQGCGNLVLACPHTTSGETLVRALRPNVERASSVGIFFAK